MSRVDTETVLEQLDELDGLLDTAEDEAPQGGGFFADVREKANDMREWIEANGVATDKQSSAVDNWMSGVRKWLRD